MIVALSIAFAALFGLRVFFLLILRRDEIPNNPSKPCWPHATVIRTDPVKDPP